MEKISWSDFEKIDMRVGTIITAAVFPEAHIPAYKLQIDFGDLGIKQSSARITALYSQEELAGKQVVAVVNFPSKQIGPFISECLVLGAVGNEGAVVLLEPGKKTVNGLRIA